MAEPSSVPRLLWDGSGEVMDIFRLPPVACIVHDVLLSSSDSLVEPVWVGVVETSPVPAWVTQEELVSSVGVQKGVLTSDPEVDETTVSLVREESVDLIWTLGGGDEAGWPRDGVQA